MNAKMMNVHMVNEIESYLQLGRHNADNISLTELLSSSLSSSPVVAWLSPGCKAYVELVSDWQPFAPVPCLHGVAAQILPPLAGPNMCSPLNSLYSKCRY